MKTIGITLVVATVAGLGAVMAHHPARQDRPLARYFSVPFGDPNQSASIRLEKDIDARLAARDYAGAERIVDDYLSGRRKRIPAFNEAVVHEVKARLLLRRGADAEALERYMGLLHGRLGWWTPDSRKLAPVLELAMRLKRPRETDEIATRIALEPSWKISDFPILNPGRPGTTPNGRLAHAYLSLAVRAMGDMDYDGEVGLCERARALAPDEPYVLVRLASAYNDRHSPGDRTKTQTLLEEAYRLIPANSPARQDLRVFGSGYGLDAAGPNPKTSLQEELGAYIREEPKREAARQAKIEREKAAFQAQQEARRAAFMVGRSASHLPPLKP